MNDQNMKEWNEYVYILSKILESNGISYSSNIYEITQKYLYMNYAADIFDRLRVLLNIPKNTDTKEIKFNHITQDKIDRWILSDNYDVNGDPYNISNLDDPNYKISINTSINFKIPEILVLWHNIMGSYKLPTIYSYNHGDYEFQFRNVYKCTNNYSELPQIFSELPQIFYDQESCSMFGWYVIMRNTLYNDLIGPLKKDILICCDYNNKFFGKIIMDECYSDYDLVGFAYKWIKFIEAGTYIHGDTEPIREYYKNKYNTKSCPYDCNIINMINWENNWYYLENVKNKLLSVEEIRSIYNTIKDPHKNEYYKKHYPNNII